MSQTPELTQDRIISGKGLLRVPSEFKNVRYFTLYSDVVRIPTNQYKNLNYNPSRSRYGTLVFLRDGYVQFQHSIEYPNQSWDFVCDYSSQNLIALKCVYEGILTTFTNLAVALAQTPGSTGLFVTTIEDKIKDYEYLNLSFDEVRVVCYGNTAIQLRLYATRNDTCAIEKDKASKPIPPTRPVPPVPPGVAIPEISTPYAPVGSGSKFGDDGNTTPNLLDAPILPIVPFVCTLTFKSYRSDVSGFVGDNSFVVPNASYVSAYVDKTFIGQSSYTYYTRSIGDSGIVTLQGPFSPLNSTTITYDTFNTTCV